MCGIGRHVRVDRRGVTVLEEAALPTLVVAARVEGVAREVEVVLVPPDEVLRARTDLDEVRRRPGPAKRNRRLVEEQVDVERDVRLSGAALLGLLHEADDGAVLLGQGHLVRGGRASFDNDRQSSRACERKQRKQSQAASSGSHASLFDGGAVDSRQRSTSAGRCQIQEVHEILPPAMTELERGRAAYDKQAWMEAYESLARADELAPLAARDLAMLAGAAYMVGRDDEYVSGLERAYDLYVAEDDVPRAVRCAFWIGHSMLFRGRSSHAKGWFARARAKPRRPRGRMCRARLSADPGLAGADGRRGLRDGEGHRGRGCRHRRAVRRRRPGLAGEGRPGPRAAQAGPSRGGAAARRRGRWWLQRPGSCRRSSRGSSTATRSRSAETRTS